MARWEIGVASTTSDETNWTGEYVLANHEGQALEQAEFNGYYRNVRVRPEQIDVAPAFDPDTAFTTRYAYIDQSKPFGDGFTGVRIEEDGKPDKIIYAIDPSGAPKVEPEPEYDLLDLHGKTMGIMAIIASACFVLGMLVVGLTQLFR
jgi:hypothetical protein